MSPHSAPTADPDLPRNRLDRTTWIPLGVFFVFLIAVVTGVMWMNTTLGNLTHAVDPQRLAIEDVRTDLTAATMDRWSRRDMGAWAKLLQAENPDLKIPEPED